MLFPGLLNDLKDYPEGLIGLLLAGRGLGNLCSFLIVVQATTEPPPEFVVAAAEADQQPEMETKVYAMKNQPKPAVFSAAAVGAHDSVLTRTNKSVFAMM